MKWKLNKRGAMGVGTAVVFIVALFVVAILGPTAIGLISNANTANWDSSVVTIFQVMLPILAVIGLALKFIPRRAFDLVKNLTNFIKFW